MAFDALANYAGAAMNMALILIAGLLAVGAVIGGIVFYGRWKRYKEYDCVVYEHDGTGQTVIKSDQAGVFVDRKTGNKRFFMKRANVGLSPDNIPYMPTAGGRKVVHLYRTGLKNFRYVSFKFSKEGITNAVGEEDVNWALNAYDRQKKTFGQDKLLQYLPFIILAFVCIIILILFIYFFKGFPVLAQVAEAFRDAAQKFAEAKAGTVVLPT